jgi:HPt (histidine-containing phosphotransfer) domain-containing protein
VSEGELERLRQAVRRLFEGQQEALEVLRQALEDDTPMEEALGGLEDIMEGSLEDARAILGMDERDEA